ncbi:MAG: biotin--[acetyl-CoA-carboxylase] ligase [Calditerrivibrio sp.]|nr:biotin--[acetyl-CoA-carboxylase] ligase [Calditerrivibrio sp.]MCA1932137.1 biotin--[acetyl-CoA-carboxylase] ligase [Calditerrivibrio sp.]MCA1981194.1 biotin--[acetyl-CoA-carboxylase] ligase [Calditerrivibrio sp.]
MLDLSFINERLTSESKFYNKIYYFDSIDSTNSEGMVNNYPYFSVIIAKTQTSGKGRSGRVWYSTVPENIYLSFIMPPFHTEKLLPLNILTAYSIVEGLKSIIDLRIKWPNDLVVNKKKIGGILLESKFLGNKLEKVVVGVGLNVNQEFFDNSLEKIATSIFIETNLKQNISEIACNIIVSFEIFFQQFLKNSIDIIEKWCNYSENLGKQIKIHINGDKKTFTEKGITEQGELLVLDENGFEKKIISGDIDL